MQTQVGTCNHAEVKGNILGSKSSIHDRNFRKFWRYFFHLIFAGSTFFFKILKALHKFELKNPTVKVSVPMLIALRKLLLKNYFQILIFDKRQMKLLQTRRKKLQEEIHESLDEVVKEHWESRLQFLLKRCSEHSTTFPEKCPCKRWDLQQRHIRKLEVLSGTVWEYYNAVSVSSCTFFRQYLFLCCPDSIILIS